MSPLLVTIALAAAPTPAAASDVERAGPVTASVDRRWVSFVVGGVGLSSIAAGVALNLQAKATLGQLQRASASDSPSTVMKLRDGGKTAEALSLTFFAVGGAALVTSVVLFFVLAPDVGASVAVAPLAGGGVVSVTGVW